MMCSISPKIDINHGKLPSLWSSSRTDGRISDLDGDLDQSKNEYETEKTNKHNCAIGCKMEVEILDRETVDLT